MACRQKQGTSKQPIEILDSDDEPHALQHSYFIDLTQEDAILPKAPSNLQQPTIKNKDFSTPSAPDSFPQSIQPLKPASLHLSFVTGQNTHPTSTNEGKPSIISNYPPYQVLHSDSDGSIERNQELILESDVNSELSDVMDRSSRRRPRRAHQRSSWTTDDTHFNIPKSSGATVREPSSEPADVEPQRAHNDTDGQPSPCPILAAVEEVLRSIWRDMERDHSLYVNNQLYDALKRSRELQGSLPDFSDAIDPFADMLQINERKAISQAKVQINIVDGNVGAGGAEISQIPERLPRYKHYVTITRSFLVPDNHQLYFEPYLGQSVEENEIATRRWLEKLRKLYDPPEDCRASRQREHVSRLKVYLPRMLERLNQSRADVLSYIIDTGLVIIGAPKTPLARLLTAFKNVFGTEISDLFPEYDEYLDAVKNYRRKQDKPEEVDPVKKLLEPHLLSCPVCHVYLCGIHGVYETDDSEDEGKDETDKADKNYADMNMTYEGIVHRYTEKTTQSEPVTDSIYNGKPCGSKCFSIKGLARAKAPEWSPDESTYFKALFLGMESEPRAACILAPLMARPCYDVQKFVLSLAAGRENGAKSESRKSEKLDWYDNKRKKIRVDLDWGKKTNTHLHDKIRQPTGCDHLGVSCFEARDDCSCNREGILCDKFCACPDDCYMKFTGCNCSKGDAPCSQESLTCPCKLLNRECDPDLCHTCGAVETVNPFVHDQGPLAYNCCNTDIQRGFRKRLLVGESSHPGDIGFGAYMAEPVKQGEFIAEYVGEIISYAECGRRSEIYDKLKVSFIFDLNDEVVIDSYRYGNVERFINHSKKHANCKPLVKLVNGEHRIGFFALKDLDAGVELFFDYGKEFVFKQGLKEMDSIPKMKGVGSKKAKTTTKLVEDASEEDDAAMQDDDDSVSVVVYSFPKEDEVNQHDEEEQDDMVRPSRRPRRNVKMPKKYTR